MSNLDRIIRLLVAAVAVYAYYAGLVTGTVGIVAIAVAGIFLLTSLVSFCPLYRVFGISTCPVPGK